MAAPTIKPLPPKEAIAFFRAKGLARSFDWQEVWQSEHARAFTVAKAMSFDVLADIRQAVDTAIAEGRTFEQFKAGLQPLLEQKGWWGRKAMIDPQTGEERNVQLGSPRRLRTIFNTNLRTAYQAGRWERIQGSKALLPFLRYHHTPQEHPRIEHEAWGAQPVVLPVDDPWWDEHYPPNGWGCKCFVTQESHRSLAREKLEVTQKPIAFPPKGFTNTRTGEVTKVPGGIDPGFANNVGKDYLGPQTPTPTPDGGLFPEAPGNDQAAAPVLPEPRPGPQALPEDVDQAEAQAAFLHELDAAPGEAKVMTDAGGAPVAIGPDLLNTIAGDAAQLAPAKLRGLALAGQALADPDEIRWVWVKTPGGGVRMARRYVARTTTGAAVVDVLSGGSASWGFTTSLEDGFDLGARRAGVVTWSRPAP